MPNYWLIMMDEDNYVYTIKNGIYGLPKSSSKVRQSVKPGDVLIVYVMKEEGNCRELCGSFAAALEVVGDWSKSSGSKWPSEVKGSRIIPLDC